MTNVDVTDSDISNSSNKDLFKLLGKFEKQQKMPPVESWNPTVEGEIDINIDSQGRWFHEGGHFDRQDLARMFASILRREGDDYYLVTPVEKLKIRVADVPFRIVLMNKEQDGINFISSMGDEVKMSPEHPLEFRQNKNLEYIPYIMIRNNLWAKLNQSVYYELMNLVEEAEGGFFIRGGDYQVKIPD